MNFRILVLTACFLFFIGFGESFCEEQAKLINKNEASGIAFERALKNYDTQKQKDQEELAGKLNVHLERLIEDWINAAKKDKASKLNTRLSQKWEKLALIYPISPSHYEYNLRGYKYYLSRSDIIKTDSLISPYKAVVIVIEDLYVEKYHSPDISDADPYFYTVSTGYTMNFEYKNENFTLVNIDSKIVSIKNDCPDEIKKLRL